MTDSSGLASVYDRLNDLVQALEAYRSELEAERVSVAGNEGLHHLLGLQLRRTQQLLDYLDNDADETIRDLVDRGHVIREARSGRFN